MEMWHRTKKNIRSRIIGVVDFHCLILLSGITRKKRLKESLGSFNILAMYPLVTVSNKIELDLLGLV